MSKRIVLLSVVLPLLCASIASAAETGMLYVKSDPPGATVLIDGEERGKTPLLIRNVKAGHRVVEVRPADGPGVRDLVTVEAGKVANVNIRIRQEPASLTVISDPLEADVHLDRRERGTTPVTIESIEPGEHEVILFLLDYERAVRKVELEPGENRVLEVKLRRKGPVPFPQDEKPPALEAMDEAEEKLAAVLGRFEGLVGKGHHAGARRLAEESARRGSLRDVAANLRAAARVAGALEARQEAIRKGAEALRGKKVKLKTKSGPRKGKVEEVTEAGITLATEIRAGGRVLGSTRFMVAWRDLAPTQEEQLAKDWDAKGADGTIARAFLALQREDSRAAQRAVEAAESHLLSDYVRRRIAVLRPAPAKAPARTKKPRPRGTSTPGVGLVAHWKFDEGRGEIARDSSGNGNHGTLGPSAQIEPADPRWVRGRLGNALEFDGDDDWIRVPHSTGLNAFPITVCAWLQTVQKAGGPGVANKYACRSQCGYQIVVIDGRVHGWYFRGPEGRVHAAGHGLKGGHISDGRWHHVALLVDASGGKLYVDGIPKHSLPWTGTPGATTTTEDFSIGRYPGAPDGYFRGRIDDVRIYNRALSAEEIRALAAGH